MSKKVLVQAAVVIACAVVLGVWVLRPAPRAIPTNSSGAKDSSTNRSDKTDSESAESGDPAVHPDLARVTAARLVRPKSEAEVSELATRIEQSVLGACKRLPRDRAISEAQARDLARLIRTRVELLLVPDYEKYRKHAMDLTGRDPDGTAPGGVIVSRKMWDNHTERYRLAPVDVDAVDVRSLYFRGKMAPFDVVGAVSGSRDTTKFYSSIGMIPTRPELDVYDVSLPIEVLAYGTEKPVTVLYVLSVAWRPDRQRWVPWQVALNDVMDQSDLLSPWL